MFLMMTRYDVRDVGRKDISCYCYYYFPSLFRFVYNFCYFCSGHFIICYCLLIHVYNLESEYSTPQLLTSDSRYSYSVMSQYTQLLTSDSSCLIPRSIRSQSRSSVPQRLSHVPRNIPPSRIIRPLQSFFPLIISIYSISFQFSTISFLAMSTKLSTQGSLYLDSMLFSLS